MIMMIELFFGVHHLVQLIQERTFPNCLRLKHLRFRLAYAVRAKNIVNKAGFWWMSFLLWQIHPKN